MTRVDFYLLDDVSVIAAARFACRLALKATQAGSRVYVHTSNEDQAAEIDALMWEYPRARFLGHECADSMGNSSAARSSAPVIVGCGEQPMGDEVLINLADAVPNFIGRFDRVAEVIVQERKLDGRERYKFYRDCGYPLHHHEMTNWEEA